MNKCGEFGRRTVIFVNFGFCLRQLWANSIYNSHKRVESNQAITLVLLLVNGLRLAEWSNCYVICLGLGLRHWKPFLVAQKSSFSPNGAICSIGMVNTWGVCGNAFNVFHNSFASSTASKSHPGSGSGHSFCHSQENGKQHKFSSLQFTVDWDTKVWGSVSTPQS